MNSQMTILQLNKGDSLLNNRVGQINDILDKYKPELFLINELNLDNNDTVTPNNFPGYRLFTDGLAITDRFSRSGILAKKDLHIKRRTDLEAQGISTIWLQLSHPGKKPMLVQNIYRQFQRLGIPNTDSIAEQTKRWNIILEKWELATREQKEILTMGDINLNKLSWDKDKKDMNPYEKSQDKMVQMLKDKILTKGHIALNSKPTKEPLTPEERPSCIDIIFTNKKDKITNFETKSPTFSNHYLQIVRRSIKNKKNLKNYIKIRTYKNFNKTQFQENIINHPDYIINMHERDPDTISEGIQKIIRESLDPLAPIRRIQITNKNSNKLSEEARELLALRDNAHDQFKMTKEQEDLRQYRHYKTAANNLIGRERFQDKRDKFHKEDTKPKDKWNMIKEETGQKEHTTPKLIVEGEAHHTSPQQIANAMNRQYIQKIRKVKSDMDPPRTNPMENYYKYLGQSELSFTFRPIAMSELRKSLSDMKSTGSSAGDFISVRAIKNARKQLEPLLLNLTNRVILTGTFPRELKITKVIPIQKPEKDATTTDGWRPVNIVCAMSKIIERILMKQLAEHLENNEIISHSHHGSVRGKSTQTLLIEVYDKLLENLHNEKDSALILLDQSKAYDLVDHPILLLKLQALGLKGKTLQLMENFLQERKQYVQVQGFDSPKLLIGPQSVVQGSTMSCMLYLLYILDLPTLFHNERHTPDEQRRCNATSLETYVDDNYLIATKGDNKDLKEAVQKTMDKISDYTNTNRLQLNSDKSQIMIVTKDRKLRENFNIVLENKTVRHQRKVRILGNVIDEDLSWDKQMTSILIPQLANRVRTLKLTAKYLDRKFRRQYTTGVFRSKLLFGIESWGGCSKGLITKVQNLQEKAARIAGGREDEKKPILRIQKELKWLPIKTEIKIATFKQVYTILNKNTPAEILSVMPMNKNGRRIETQRKLATKPRWLGATQ